MLKVFEVFQKYFTYHNPKIVVFWFMKCVTFDIAQLIFNGVNSGLSSLRWLMDLAIYAAKEIVYLFPPHLFHLCKIEIRGKAFCISVVFKAFRKVI